MFLYKELKVEGKNDGRDSGQDPEYTTQHDTTTVNIQSIGITIGYTTNDSTKT